MTKNVIIAIVIVLVFGAGAFFFFQNQQRNKMSSSGNAITSFKDSIISSVSMECDYTDEGGIKTKAYIKNGSIRADYAGSTSEEPGGMIITEKNIYMWNAQSGLVINIPQVTPGQETAAEQKNLKRKENLITNLDKYKRYCKNASVSDSIFTPPSDINFQDYSQMIERMIPTIAAQSGVSEGKVRETLQ